MPLGMPASIGLAMALAIELPIPLPIMPIMPTGCAITWLPIIPIPPVGGIIGAPIAIDMGPGFCTTLAIGVLDEELLAGHASPENPPA